MTRIRRSRVLRTRVIAREEARDARILQALTDAQARILRESAMDRMFLSAQLHEDQVQARRSFDVVLAESQEYAAQLIARHRRVSLGRRIRETWLGF